MFLHCLESAGTLGFASSEQLAGLGVVFIRTCTNFCRIRETSGALFPLCGG